jgi:hypothetical protein
MGNRLISSILAVAAIPAILPVELAQTAQQPAAATRQISAFVPDLSGFWIVNFPRNPKNPYARNFAYFRNTQDTDQPSMLPWAAERYKVARSGRSQTRPDMTRSDVDPPLYPYRLPLGFPRVHGTGSLEIIRSPGRVLILVGSDMDSVQREFARMDASIPKPLLSRSWDNPLDTGRETRSSSRRRI